MRYPKFGDDWTLHWGDMTSLPVWRLRRQFQLAVIDKRSCKSKIHLITFVRLGLKIICANFGEDWTKFVTCEKFLNFWIKFKIAENLSWRINLVQEAFLFSLSQGIRGKKNFDSSPNGSRVTGQNALWLAIAPPCGQSGQFFKPE